ncbi:hypothetical protein ULMS_25300 [Patiriisocius marinistellae]|uniref:Peptidase C1A papain C-terminal domain-containing protein n=1 Tax=Patiriisocius marinistellae TaxID=2494560 RepID=A0A5J4G0D5_9FLAO|nr:C1 family peptidase [Patiriisocius marinistellae]GEQ87022.1 hypothetical protein ULMS_25300 [Patiriisocius marinistellae]
MKKIILLISILIVILFISCENEPVDIGTYVENTDNDTENPDDPNENPDPDPDIDPDPDLDPNEDYYTGGICIGSGDYLVNPNNVPDEIIIPQDLPEFYDLSEFLPPVMSQGQQGSCVSWAVTYYMKSMQENIETGIPFNDINIMSPAYTYNQITLGNCVGTQVEATLSILKNKGACSMDSFPYTETTCVEQPTQEQDDEAFQNRISDFKNLSGENMTLEMKALLNEQKPIIITAYLSSQFGREDDFGLSAYREHVVDYSLDRCHAMLVVGYSDEYNAFKIVNSWGENWGDNGFVWFDYKAFDNASVQNAAFKVINQAFIAYDL